MGLAERSPQLFARRLRVSRRGYLFVTHYNIHVYINIYIYIYTYSDNGSSSSSSSNICTTTTTTTTTTANNNNTSYQGKPQGLPHQSSAGLDYCYHHYYCLYLY